MRQRQNAKESILRGQGPDLRRPSRREQKIPVRQHDALRNAGRTGRVNQHGDAVPDVGIDCLRLSVFVQRTDSDGSKIANFFDERSLPIRVLSGMR